MGHGATPPPTTASAASGLLKSIGWITGPLSLRAIPSSLRGFTSGVSPESIRGRSDLRLGAFEAKASCSFIVLLCTALLLSNDSTTDVVSTSDLSWPVPTLPRTLERVWHCWLAAGGPGDDAGARRGTPNGVGVGIRRTGTAYVGWPRRDGVTAMPFARVKVPGGGG